MGIVPYYECKRFEVWDARDGVPYDVYVVLRRAGDRDGRPYAWLTALNFCSDFIGLAWERRGCGGFFFYCYVCVGDVGGWDLVWVDGGGGAAEGEDIWGGGLNFFFHCLRLHGEHLAADFEEWEIVFGEDFKVGDGAGGSEIELFTIVWVVGKVFGACVKASEVGEVESTRDVVDEVDAFLEGVDSGDAEVGAGDSEGDGGEAGAGADVDDGWQMTEVRGQLNVVLRRWAAEDTCVAVVRPYEWGRFFEDGRGKPLPYDHPALRAPLRRRGIWNKLGEGEAIEEVFGEYFFFLRDAREVELFIGFDKQIIEFFEFIDVFL